MIQTKTILAIVILMISQLTQSQNTLKNTLPKSGRLKSDKPKGKGWVNLLDSIDHWSLESSYWTLDPQGLHGKIDYEKLHHYGYTNKTYKDFELNVMIKMTGGEDANSGVCIRINPTNFDNAPGYQIDMGKGYWGSLWEERRGNMIQKYPDSLAMKVARLNDWNHYYIKAKDHHIEAWLNGVKTIDMVHPSGFTEGRIGIQLCHMKKPTTVDVKTLYIRGL